jgi:hypothetical protein
MWTSIRPCQDLEERDADEGEERVVVLGAHAVVQPLAVVVEVQHALVARAAVLGPAPHARGLHSSTFRLNVNTCEGILDDFSIQNGSG